MRKWIAYLLLFFYCFSNTELHELVRLSVFIAHFEEHQQKDSGTTLLSFIEMHYFSGNKVDDDYQKDQQLPFKAIDCGNAGPSLTIPVPEIFVLRPVDFFIPRSMPAYDQSALPSCYATDIWQPPKSC